MNREKIWPLAMLMMALFVDMSGASAQGTVKKQGENARLAPVLKEIVEAELRGDSESVEALKAKVEEFLANDPRREVKRQGIEHNLQSLRDEMTKKYSKIGLQQTEGQAREKATVTVKSVASDDTIQELNRRLRHLNAAIEHLSAAEMPDAVEQLIERRLRLERFIEQAKKDAQSKLQLVEKPAQVDADLVPLLKELRRDLDNLRKEFRELREAIKNR